MARITIGGGNTRVGEVYLDALFRQRALDQEQNRINMQSRIEQQRIMRDAADQEMRAREAALQRAQQLQMAREGQAFNSREAAAQRMFEADKLAQMQDFEAEKMDKQTQNEKDRLELMDKLERQRWEAQNEKLREQKDQDYERNRYDKAVELASSVGIELSDGWTADEIYSGIARKAELDKDQKLRDDLEAKLAAAGHWEDGMQKKFKPMADAVKSDIELAKKREYAKVGALPKNDPIFKDYPEIETMNDDAIQRRSEELDLKRQANLKNQMSTYNDIVQMGVVAGSKAASSAEKMMGDPQKAYNDAFKLATEEPLKQWRKTYNVKEDSRQTEPLLEVTEATPVASSKQRAAALFAGMPKELAQEQMNKVGSSYQNSLAGGYRNPALDAVAKAYMFVNPMGAIQGVRRELRGYSDQERTKAEMDTLAALSGAGYKETELAQELERQRIQSSQPWLGRFLQWVSGDEQPKYYQ